MEEEEGEGDTAGAEGDDERARVRRSRSSAFFPFWDRPRSLSCSLSWGTVSAAMPLLSFFFSLFCGFLDVFLFSNFCGCLSSSIIPSAILIFLRLLSFMAHLQNRLSQWPFTPQELQGLFAFLTSFCCSILIKSISSVVKFAIEYLCASRSPHSPKSSLIASSTIFS